MNRSWWMRAAALVLAVIVTGGVWALRERTQPTVRFNHFTREAQRVLQRAQEEATRHGHRYIDTAHLLAAVLAEPPGDVSQALQAGGLDPGPAAAQLQELLAAEDRPSDEDMGLTPEAKRVVEQTVMEARRFGGGDVRLEHLVLGLLDVDSASAGGSLVEHLGGQPAIIRRALEDRLPRT